jgi:hypothetical protein
MVFEEPLFYLLFLLLYIIMTICTVIIINIIMLAMIVIISINIFLLFSIPYTLITIFIFFIFYTSITIFIFILWVFPTILILKFLQNRKTKINKLHSVILFNILQISQYFLKCLVPSQYTYFINLIPITFNMHNIIRQFINNWFTYFISH